jgi:hypothetical protein
MHEIEAWFVKSALLFKIQPKKTFAQKTLNPCETCIHVFTSNICLASFFSNYRCADKLILLIGIIDVDQNYYNITFISF